MKTLDIGSVADNLYEPCVEALDRAFTMWSELHSEALQNGSTDADAAKLATRAMYQLLIPEEAKLIINGLRAGYHWGIE